MTQYSLDDQVLGILARVIRPSRNHLLCCLFAVMLVMVRTADAHAHFCFDGKEPATTIHVADGEVHPCETDSSNGHKGDKDVQLSADVVAKKPVPGDVWASGAPTVVVQFSVLPFSELVLGSAQTDEIRPQLFRVPPLRGPPA